MNSNKMSIFNIDDKKTFKRAAHGVEEAKYALQKREKHKVNIKNLFER